MIEILSFPIINILVVLYQFLFFLHIPSALGFSIILLTILMRLVLYPLTASQLRVSKKMQTIAPHISKIKDKHKNDAKRQQQEMMRLYKEHGVNPAAGCLPTLIQLPFLWGLYSALQDAVKFNLDKINSIIYLEPLKLKALWDPHFFGIPLAQNPSHLITTMGPIILLVPILTGVLQFAQSKMMISKPAETKDVKEKPNKQDFASAFQTQSLYIFPAMIGFFSYSFPIGLSLYWITFTIFGILQQYKIQGWGGMQDWINKFNSLRNK